MTETIIAAVITGIVAIAVCVINNYFQNKATQQQHDKTIALIDYKLTELTKRVDKHNNVIERTYKLEEHESVLDEKIKVINHRIHDLEKEDNDYES